MARRGYSNVASTLALSGTLDNVSSTNTITVATAPTGWPGTFPYFAVIDPGTASEELVSVTAASGTSLTITRAGALSNGYGSVTRAHANGAVIKHVASAADFDEANAHINSAATHVGLVVTPTSTSAVAMVVRALAAQTGDLEQWQNSDGTVVARMTAGGMLKSLGVDAGTYSVSASSYAVNNQQIEFYDRGSNAPTPSTGHGYLYVVGGVLRYTAPSGTVTTLAGP